MTNGWYTDYRTIYNGNNVAPSVLHPITVDEMLALLEEGK